MNYWILSLSILMSISCKGVYPVQSTGTYTISVNAISFKVDPFNNLYVLDDKNKIYRYSENHKLLYTYADNTLGKITYMDITDPLKILIYKKDYGTVIILDNTLSEIDRFNVLELGFQGATLVATATDGYYWLYDHTEYKMIKIDPQGRRIISSISMIELNLQEIQPHFLQEKQGKVILKDRNEGIILFDNFGQYMKRFPFQIESDIQFDGNHFIYYENGKIVFYNIQYYTEEEYIIPVTQIKTDLQQVKTGSNFLYFKYRNGIDIKPRQS